MTGGFLHLLRSNRNYRYTWMGQVVSEIGDHFSNIAIFSLVMERTGSGMVVSGVFLARAIAMITAGPLAGVVLDRLNRRHVMMLSDAVRGLFALAFILTLQHRETTWLYVLSALLSFASPFFTSGRQAILPVIATRAELHTANSLTQTTAWTAVAAGSFLGGASVAAFGYSVAFVFNALSFFFSGFCILLLREPTGQSFRAERRDLGEDRVARPMHEYIEGLRYMRSNPLVFGITLIGVGWASGGGAAQILFSLYGDKVFHRGGAGIGQIWGCAGIGLIAGGLIANRWGRSLRFAAYKRAVGIAYFLHGLFYVLFARSESYAWALVFIALSRTAVAISSVMNMAQLLRHVDNDYRGRVFSTNESVVWATMMLSMVAAGAASTVVDTRVIGVVSGVLSGSTGIVWLTANAFGKLRETPQTGVEPDEIEVHGEPNG
jgi:MFS family permease